MTNSSQIENRVRVIWSVAQISGDYDLLTHDLLGNLEKKMDPGRGADTRRAKRSCL